MVSSIIRVSSFLNSEPIGREPLVGDSTNINTSSFSCATLSIKNVKLTCKYVKLCGGNVRVTDEVRLKSEGAETKKCYSLY